MKTPAKRRAVVLCILVFAASAHRVNAADPYAKAVVFAKILSGSAGNSQTNVTNALGPADNVEVSLGGPGASLMLDMGEATPVVNGPGADLEVREIGAAYGGVDESYRVLVSNSTDTNSFLYVGTGQALSFIDISPSQLASARYVWLQDLATETLSTPTPGSDIDSLRVLFYQGSDSDLKPPAGAAARMTGQGAFVSWKPSTDTNVTGYAVRRSLDGISFSSTADVSLSSRETAWLDTGTPPVIGPLFYAVSAVGATSESGPVIVSVPGEEFAVSTNAPLHAGDDAIPAWEDPSAERELALTFWLGGFADGPQAELVMDLWDVDNSGNALFLNGCRIGSVSPQANESWAQKTLRFPAGVIHAGTNTLVVSARNSSGGTTGSLDDFQVRNLSVRTFGLQMNLITRAQFESIAAGQTNVVLRWVVEQTPVLTPATWETVSSPVEWTGTLANSNGFYRLRDLP